MCPGDLRILFDLGLQSVICWRPQATLVMSGVLPRRVGMQRQRECKVIPFERNNYANICVTHFMQQNYPLSHCSRCVKAMEFLRTRTRPPPTHPQR